MKVVQGKFSKKRWVVNSKGKRLTPKYPRISEYNYGPFYLAKCHELGYLKEDRIYVFDAKSEKKANVGYVDYHVKINENVFAFHGAYMYYFYDTQGHLLRSDVTRFSRCKKHPYIIATIEENEYFLDEDVKIITEPFISATDFDEFGYSVIQGVDNKYQVMDEEFLAFPPLGVECDELVPLSKDFFRFRRGDFYGVIDKEGKEILPAIYQDVKLRSGNHFELKYNEKLGLADSTGKIVFECFYDEIMETPDKFAVKDFARIETSKVLEATK